MLPSQDKLPILCREGVSKCYGCGEDNPIGLKLRFDAKDGTVVTEFVASELHQGWPGFVRGGILFTLLDEAMGHTFYMAGVVGVTARAASPVRDRPRRAVDDDVGRRPGPVGCVVGRLAGHPVAPVLLQRRAITGEAALEPELLGGPHPDDE